jgi:hypothetical protein
MVRGAKSPEQATTTPAPASGNERLSAVSGCPADYSRLGRMDGCLKPDARRCDYAEARCACVPRPQCGDAAPAADSSPGVWACVLAQCPLDVPLEGERCDVPSRVLCSYGLCRGEQIHARCVGDIWEVERE